MRISYSTIPGNLNTSIGYGWAGYNIVRSLQKLGHEVPFQDPSCAVQIHFSQPEFYEFNENQYKIGYTPWESTDLPESWLPRMNECDEIWATSPLIAEWYADAGVKPPISVYQHGIDASWTPQKRRRGNKIRFLHVGEPAPRKGAQMAADAFLAAFGNRDDVHLTIKAHDYSTVRANNPFGPIDIHPNISLIKRELTAAEMVSLYLNHDVFVYPSFGEGFGFLPHQAMGTGMVTMCVDAWAPYKDFILPECRIASTLGESPWPTMHPGKVFWPDKDNLIDMYRTVFDNFDDLNTRSFALSHDLHEKYNWETLTSSAFKKVVEKFS